MEPNAVIADSLPPVEDKPVVSDSSISIAPVDDGVAAQRATKAKFGVASLDLSPDEISSKIKQGQEDLVRQYASSKIDSLKQEQKLGFIDEVAKQKGGPLTQEELGAVYTKMRQYDKPTDPKSVFEEYYSQAYTDLVKQVAQNNPDSDLNKSLQQFPEAAENIRLMGTTWLIRNELKLTTVQNLQAIQKGQSWPDYAMDWLKWSMAPVSLVPGYSDYMLRGRVPGTGIFEGGAVPLGPNLTAQMDALNKLPLEQFKTVYPKIIDQLRKEDPEMAIRFATAMLGQSSNEEALNSLSTAIDLTFIKPLAAFQFAKNIAGRLTTEKALQTVSKTVTEGLAPTTKLAATSADIHEAMGDIKTAATLRSADNLVADMKGQSDPTQRGLEATAALFNRTTSAFKGNVGNLDRELVNRTELLDTNARDAMIKTLVDNFRVDRVPGVLESREANAAIVEEAKHSFPGMDNAILDASTAYRSEVDNGIWVDLYFGKTDGTLIGNLRDATTFKNERFRLIGSVAKDEEGDFVKKYPKQPIGKEGPLPEVQGPIQKGAGYYVKVSVPVDETGHVMRDLVFNTMDATPTSRVTALIGYIRTPADTLAKNNYENRLVATVAPSNFLQVVKDATKPIRDLQSWASLPYTDKKQKWNDFLRVLDDVEKQNVKFEGNVQLQNYYQKTFNRMADDQEVAAYFAYRRAENLFEVFHKVNVISKKTRLGEMNHTFSAFDPALETKAAESYKTVNADGKLLHTAKEMGTDTLLIMGRNVGEERLVKSTDFLKTQEGQAWAAEVEKGTEKLIRLSEPSNRPFQGFGLVKEQRVRYVSGNRVETGQLRWDMTDNMSRPAQDTYEHYVAQARIKYDDVTDFHHYEGDTKIFGDMVGSRARDFAKRMDTVRLLIKDKKFAEAEAANPVHDGFTTVKEWFDSGRLSLNEPIRVLPRGGSLGELDSTMVDRYGRDKFKNQTREGYGRFFKDGDTHELYTYEKTGTAANPLYNIMPAKRVDAIKSLNRSTTRLVNDIYLDDYKIFSVEHWIQEAKKLDLLNVSPERMADSPYYYFWNAKEHMYNNPDKYVATQNMLTAQYQVRQFLGITDEMHNWLHSTAQWLADSIYDKGYERIALTPAYLLPKLRDPASFIRSITFHVKLGLLSPAQFIAQSQTYANIYGIAGPTYAAPGTKAGLLHQYSRWNSSPEIIARLDQLATQQIVPGTARWLPGQFTEARNMFINSGFFNVAGEHALKDNIFSFNAITASVQDKFLNPFALLFTEGERNVRIAAAYTSYLEFRGANPTKIISTADQRAILARADLLNGNMTRAANSRIQEGLMSIPTQFLTYQARITEQMMGKRLTDVERTRMIMVYSALYGIPGAAGVTGIPFADLVNKDLKEKGYNVGSNFVADALLKGIPEALMGYAVGPNEKGQNTGFFDVQGRYGLPGFEPLRQLMHSDRDFLNIVGGASFTTMREAFASASPFWNFATRWARDDDKRLTPTMDNFLDIWKGVSSVNAGFKLQAAINTGKLFTKNENYITDVSKPNAIFQFLSGLSPQSETDAFTQKWSTDTAKELQSHTLGLAIKEFRRGMVAEKDNPTQAKVFFQNAKAYLEMGDYPLEKRMDFLSIALQGYESYVDRMNRNFLTRDVPVSEREPRMKSMEQILRQKK